MGRLRLATVWLGGCSGCHMSFLDMDEFLIDLAGLVNLVYTPLVDVKHFPEGVNVALVEGAIANEEHLEMAHLIRKNSRVVVSFGDCAVTGNVTAIRNILGDATPVLLRAYVENGDLNPGIPHAPGIVPVLLDKVTPLHAAIAVDVYLQGCPPPASRIREVLEQLLERGTVHLEAADRRFG